MNFLKILAFNFSLLSILACSKTENNRSESENPIITVDSSEFNGRLFVNTYNSDGSAKLTDCDISIYISYDDLKRNLPLNYISNGSLSSQADFGYLLQGNYYIKASRNTLADTSLVQVLSKRTIVKNMFLK